MIGSEKWESVVSGSQERSESKMGKVGQQCQMLQSSDRMNSERYWLNQGISNSFLAIRRAGFGSLLSQDF